MFFDIFGHQTGGNGPGRHLKSFLEAVAPSWLSMGPRRATGTRFMAEIIDFGQSDKGTSLSERGISLSERDISLETSLPGSDISLSERDISV